MSSIPDSRRTWMALEDILRVVRDIDRKMDIQIKALKFKYGERLEDE